MFISEQVLAVLAAERRAAVRRELAVSRRVRVRHALAAAAYAVAKAVIVLGVILDDEPGTVRA